MFADFGVVEDALDCDELSAALVLHRAEELQTPQDLFVHWHYFYHQILFTCFAYIACVAAELLQAVVAEDLAADSAERVLGRESQVEGTLHGQVVVL